MSFYTDYPVYPTAVLNTTDYPDQADEVNWVYDYLVNAMRDEVIAIQTELGTLPKGGYASVKARLDAMGVASKIQDADGDTKVDCEESGDEDTIRMDTASVERWVLDASGRRTMPTQPAFLAYEAAGQSITEGATQTISFDTEIFDQGNNFASDIFTAPVAGRYFFNVILYFTDIDTAASDYNIRIATSNRSYYGAIEPGSMYQSDVGYMALNISALADMDASDTAKVIVTQSGGASQTGLLGPQSLFSGVLIV